MVIKVDWTLDDSRLVYGVAKNDLSFLDINEKGKLELKIAGHRITIEEINSMLLESIKEQGYTRAPSYTLRIPQMIKFQIDKLYSIFEEEIRLSNYQGFFNAVYPIKVNSMKSVIEAIKAAKSTYLLEAGTKTELILLLKSLKDEKHRTIFCNGVKDSQYLSIAKQAMEEGYNLILSIESIAEILLALEVLPLEKTKIALRIKPYVKVGGRWGTSAGRYSKFGLSIYEYLEVLRILEKKKCQDILVAIHSHAGSQISDLVGIKNYAAYITDRYIELHKKGFTKTSIINFGGGFPINYDNDLRPDVIETYVAILIQTIKEKLENTDLFVPTVMVEAGRFVTAHSSIVIVQTQDIWPIFPPPSEEIIDENLQRIEHITNPQELLELWGEVEEINCLENAEDIEKTETLRGLTKQLIRRKLAQLVSLPEFELIEFEEELRQIKREIFAADYLLLGNFSVFNSICDHVLVNQYFPILPISNLHKCPDTIVRLIDITCDSDGEVSMYKQQNAEKLLFSRDGFPLTRLGNRFKVLKGIPVGDLKDIAYSYIAIPLTGAYQDVIEMDHNLIGDLADVELTVSEEGIWSVKWLNPAQTIGQLLQEVGFYQENYDNPYLSLDSSPIIDRLRLNNRNVEE